MSMKNNVETVCPYCHEPITLVVWDSVNNKTDPDIKELIVTGEFWKNKCPKCDGRIGIEHPLLYHDPDKKIMIQYEPALRDAPRGERVKRARAMSDAWSGKSAAEGSGVAAMPGAALLAKQGYRFRLACDQLELAEKILIFDSDLDDITVEVLRQDCRKAVAAQGEKITYMLFAGYDAERSKIAMSVFLPEKKNWSQLEFGLDPGIVDGARVLARVDAQSGQGLDIKYVDAVYATEAMQRASSMLAAADALDGIKYCSNCGKEVTPTPLGLCPFCGGGLD